MGTCVHLRKAPGSRVPRAGGTSAPMSSRLYGGALPGARFVCRQASSCAHWRPGRAGLDHPEGGPQGREDGQEAGGLQDLWPFPEHSGCSPGKPAAQMGRPTCWQRQVAHGPPWAGLLLTSEHGKRAGFSSAAGRLRTKRPQVLICAWLTLLKSRETMINDFSQVLELEGRS